MGDRAMIRREFYGMKKDPNMTMDQQWAKAEREAAKKQKEADQRRRDIERR